MDTVMVRSGKTTLLLGSNVVTPTSVISSYTGVTTTQDGAAKYKDSPWSTFQAVITGTGALTATVTIEASNDGTHWNATVLGTITLSGTTSASDGFATLAAPWKYVRARLTAITGTGAAVYVLMGV